MTFSANKTGLAAALALTASVGLTLPASADAYTGHHGSHRHHAAFAHNSAYSAGYRHGFRDGHYAAAGVPLATGRSAYVDPTVAAGPRDDGIFGNGGLLGLGILGGNGVLGSGVLDGRGALGVGVLGL